MTFHHITLPILYRDDAVWIMDLTADNAQNEAIKIYLNADTFPESELIQLLVRAVRSDDFVVDCGACTGFFTLLMGALGAYVMAIEPGANNLPLLRRNISLNDFNIELAPVALGDSYGDRKFLLIDDGGANSFTQPVDRPPGERVSVPVSRLSTLVSRSPKLIKMDIEGAEFEVLFDWVNNSQWHCPYIAVEYNDIALARAGHTGDELRAMMRGNGYEMWALFADGMLPMLVPPNVELTAPRQNTNVLFASIEDVGRLWTELVI